MAPHSYVDLVRLTGSSGLNLGTGTTHNYTLRTLSEHISDAVDRWLNRQIQPVIETRTFNGDGSQQLTVPDLIAVSSITEDSNGDGTFDTTWGANDYVTWPYNANPTKEWGKPYLRVDVSKKSNGTQDEFLKGQQAYQITGTWGYQYVTSTSGLDGTIASTAGTVLTLSGTVGTVVAIGQSLDYGSEIMYVTDVANTTATSVNVTRAQYGSTGTTGTAVAVNILQYPGPITEAVMIQTARIWKRKDSAFGNAVGLSESGQMVAFDGGLDNDVKRLIGPYKRRGV